MKRLIPILLIAFILFIGITITAYGQIECEEDRFKGTTTCQTELAWLTVENSEITRANVMAVKGEDQYVIALTFASDSWQFLQSDKIYFLLDDQPKSFKLHRNDTDVQSGTTIEQYAVILSDPQIEDFVNAQSIEFKISNSEFVYPEEARRQLVELVNHK